MTRWRASSGDGYEAGPERNQLVPEPVHDEYHLREQIRALAVMAAGVAHEINNPLAALTLNLHALHSTLCDDQSLAEAQREETHEVLEEMLTCVTRIGRTVADLRNFGRPDLDKTEAACVSRALDAAIMMVGHEVRGRAVLRVRHTDPLPPVVGSSVRLCQIFVDLLLHVTDSLPEVDPREQQERVVTVETRVTDKESVVVCCQVPSPYAAGAQEGATDATVDRLLRPKGPRTGLEMCRRLLQAMGDELELEPVAGGGAKLVVRLNASTQRQATRHSSPGMRLSSDRESGPVPKPANSLGGIEVLIIDDEPALARSIRRSLPGCHVETAADGHQGLKKLQIRGYDLVLCDVVMPGLDGATVYRTVLERFPAAAERFVFMTGGTLSDDIKAMLREVKRPCLFKPFSVDTLRAALWSVGRSEQDVERQSQ